MDRIKRVAFEIVLGFVACAVVWAVVAYVATGDNAVNSYAERIRGNSNIVRQ